MAWKETTRMDDKQQFVMAYLKAAGTMSELCALQNISRPTGYKWVERFEREGLAGLADHSHATHHCPHAMAQPLQQWFLAERRAHPQWGARKLVKRLQRRQPQWPLPARSAVSRLLKQHGLIHPKRRSARKSPQAPGRKVQPRAPNELWTIDFKGQFRTADRLWCYPYTVMDSASRYLLSCRGQLNTAAAPVHTVMLALFKEYGLPYLIHSDLGSPFASVGLARLSHLSVQWIKLGIQIEFSRCARPGDNAAHERMHRTLKAHTTRPPALNCRAQQRRFDRFVQEYNFERPHEAIADRVPADLYHGGQRAMPQRIAQPEYPGYFEPRRVSHNGYISWCKQKLHLGLAFRGELVAFEEIDDGLWSLYFAHHLLARWDDRSRLLIPVPV